MNKTVFSIVFSVTILHTCTAAIVIQTSKSEVLSRLYEATIDVLSTCYGDQSTAVGVVGDSEGSIIKTLWSNNSIPAVLIDTRMKMNNSVTVRNLHKLRVFVIAATSPQQFYSLMSELSKTIWWDNESHFLILDSTLDANRQWLNTINILFIAFLQFGVLNAQLIRLSGTTNVWLFNANPFTRCAPKPWEFARASDKVTPAFNIFQRKYRKGGQICENLNFAKTMDAGGYPFHLTTSWLWLKDQVTKKLKKSPPKPGSDLFQWVEYIIVRDHQFLIDNIAMGLNASVMIATNTRKNSAGMEFSPAWISMWEPKTQPTIFTIYPQVEVPLVGVTQHTGHMTQLEKILSVTDKPCRFGMLAVYFVTLLFFKFFMYQSVMPSILDLVRLTCGMGLTKLPRKLAPTIYLACLFMYVVTFQGIYTGNLASLLTTVIPYPNVNSKRDVADLEYTIYAYPNVYNVLIEDPVIDGRIIEVSYEKICTDYVQRDPKVVCVLDYYKALIAAARANLHLSKEVMGRDYSHHWLTPNNPFASRLETIMRRWDEYGLRPGNEMLTMLHEQLVDDADVKNNTERRVMNFGDLSFAFVILGIGLTCAFLCFIGEIVIYRIRMKMAKRRHRIRLVLVREVR